MNMLKFPLLACVALCLVGCGNPQQREARYLKRGNDLFQRGDFQKARLNYRNAIRVTPTDAEPYYRLGLVDEAEQNISSAYGDFLEALQQDAHYQGALLKAADYDFAGGQIDQARQRVNIVLADTPGQPQAHALQAAFLLRQENKSAAESEASFALAQDPGNVTAISVLTGLYFSLHNMAKAEEIIDDGITRNPNNLPLLLLKASINRQAGNLAEVDAAYQKIFTLQPNVPQYHIDLADVYAASGQIDQAEAVIRAAIALQPDDWQLKRALIYLLARYRGLPAAAQEVEKYATSEPKNDLLALALAELYLKDGSVSDAAAVLERIVAKNGNDDTGLEARAALAGVDLTRGNRADAGNLSSEVLAKDAANLEALLVRASLAFDNGHYDMALTDLRTVTQTELHNKAAFSLLAETFKRQGHPDLAADTLNEFAQNNPKSQPIVDHVETDVDDRTSGKALAAISSSDLPSQMMRADALGRLGRTKEAIDLYAEILEQFPSEKIAANNFAALVADFDYKNPVMLQKAGRAINGFDVVNDPAVLDTVAWINYRQGNLPAALKVVKNLDTRPNAAMLLSPQMHYHAGIILMKAGESSAAKVHLQQALPPGANYVGIEEAKRALNQFAR